MVGIYLECFCFWYLRKPGSIILHICDWVGDQKPYRLDEPIDQLILFLWISIFDTFAENCAQTMDNPDNCVSASLSVLIWKKEDYSNCVGESEDEEFIDQVFHWIIAACLSEKGIAKISDSDVGISHSIKLKILLSNGHAFAQFVFRYNLWPIVLVNEVVWVGSTEYEHFLHLLWTVRTAKIRQIVASNFSIHLDDISIILSLFYFNHIIEY